MRRSRPSLSARGSRRTAVRPASLVQLREWKRRLSLLLDYTRAIAVKKDLSSLLPLLVDAACRILEAERATVFLLDRTTHELWSRVASGGNVIRVPMDRGIVGDAILKDRVVNIPDAYRDRRFNPAVDRATGFRTRSVLAGPLTNAQGLTLGALQILNKRRGRFTREDERMLVLFAEQASTAIENAQLLEEIQAATKDTIFRLAAAAVVQFVPRTRFDRARFASFSPSCLDFEVVNFVLFSNDNDSMSIQQSINLAIKSDVESQNVGFAFPTQRSPRLRQTHLFVLNKGLW